MEIDKELHFSLHFTITYWPCSKDKHIVALHLDGFNSIVSNSHRLQQDPFSEGYPSPDK